MDDIVVIILTLIVALFGILNKKRKKDVSSGRPAPSPGKTPDFWDMLMDDGEDLPPAPQPQEIYEEVVEEEPVRAVKPKFEYSTKPKKSKPVKRKMKRAKKSKKRTNILGEEFSLKKAVIYSEIINRKYV